MTLLIRTILIALIIFLLIRAFVRYAAEAGDSGRREEQEDKNKKARKGVPKEVGEYIDYEEVKKEK